MKKGKIKEKYADAFTKQNHHADTKWAGEDELVIEIVAQVNMAKQEK